MEAQKEAEKWQAIRNTEAMMWQNLLDAKEDMIKELKRQMATTKLETREAARLWKREEFRERQRLEREAIDARNRIEDQRKADEIRYLKEVLKQSQKEAMPADAFSKMAMIKTFLENGIMLIMEMV